MEENANIVASPPTRAMSYIAPVAAWFLPGLGHLLLRKWSRAIAIFLCVGILAAAGYFLKGMIYVPRRGDVFGLMGFLAEVGAGIFYFVGHVFERGGADTARALGDYGARFLVTAGLLNFLCVLDAWDLARKNEFERVDA
jgi:Family of unknown function (DUF6677)